MEIGNDHVDRPLGHEQMRSLQVAGDDRLHIYVAILHDATKEVVLRRVGRRKQNANHSLS